MAGDWIKLEHATPDKPEVFRIAMDLGIPPEHVTGCLVRIWVWADVQTLDGNGVCVTGVTLDRIACYEGFAQAMQKVGWLIEKDGTYSFPNFDRHNGETAKTRALTAKRVAKHRNAKSVTPALPREEKRREEVNNTKASSPDGFDAFWSAYPKKVGKGAAEKAFAKAKINGHLPDVLQAVERQKASEQWKKDGGQFIPNPATWINQKRWDDVLDVAEVQAGTFSTTANIPGLLK